MSGFFARIPATTCCTLDGSQFVGSFATTSMLDLSAGSSHFCQPSESGFPAKPPRNAIFPDLTWLFMMYAYVLPSHAGVLTDDRQVVLAGIADVAPGIRRDRDSGVGRLLHHRDHGVAEVRIGDDHVDTLGDCRFPVGERLVEVDVCARVDDLADLGVRQRLEDELHLRHLAVDVLAELLEIRDFELAARPGLAAVVLPALERQCQVDLPVRTAEPGQRDVARHLVLRDERRLEERVLERRRLRGVHLAEPLAGRDDARLRAACLAPVLPLLAETSASASAAPSTKSASTPAFRERFPGTSDSFRPSIVPPLPACLSW